MLLCSIASTKWHYTNRKYYESIGLIFTKYNDSFDIEVIKLYSESKTKVKVKCDYCGREFYKEYNSYLDGRKYIDKDACKKCKGIKMKETNLLRYNVECILQLEENKEKVKNTLLKNYGVDNPFKSPVIIQRVKDTFLRKYGTDNYTKTDEYKIKSKNTNLDKYGVEYYTQTDEYKERVIKTCKEKYGVDNVFQVEEFKEKAKETNLDKYGVEYPMQNIEIQNKVKITNLKRYGGVAPFFSYKVKEKAKITNLKRYGYEYASQSPIIREKVNNTFYKNGTQKTSTQQLEIYNILKENKYKVELNYPISNVSLDVAIFIDDIKIDLEYDSWYWHQDQKKDRRRDEFLKTQGWKIFRIKSGCKIPTFKQIQENINKLINNSNRFYTHIILDDWKGDKEVI